MTANEVDRIVSRSEAVAILLERKANEDVQLAEEVDKKWRSLVFENEELQREKICFSTH
jgi:hypothetical protein